MEEGRKEMEGKRRGIRRFCGAGERFGFSRELGDEFCGRSRDEKGQDCEGVIVNRY